MHTGYGSGSTTVSYLKTVDNSFKISKWQKGHILLMSVTNAFKHYPARLDNAPRLQPQQQKCIVYLYHLGKLRLPVWLGAFISVAPSNLEVPAKGINNGQQMKPGLAVVAPPRSCSWTPPTVQPQKEG